MSGPLARNYPNEVVAARKALAQAEMAKPSPGDDMNEPSIVAECLSCLIRTGDSQYKNLSEVDAKSHRHLRHDVREVKA